MTTTEAAEVTAVIPTHNRRHLLLRTVRSVLAQDDVAVRIVVVDDAGDDGSDAAVRELGDDRIRLVRRERNGGVSRARNEGLDQVETEWVAFVDDDDIWAPDKLRAQLAALADEPQAQWSCVGAVHLDGNGRVIGGQEPPTTADFTDLLLGANVVPGGGSGLLVRTSLVRQVGGFDPALSNLADWDFAIRLSLCSTCAIVPRPLVGYMVHPLGMGHHVERGRRELRLLEARHAAERTARGIAIDWPSWLSYCAYVADDSGRRWLSTRLHLELLFRHRHVRSIGSIGLNVLPERFLRDRLAKAVRSLPHGWVAEAEGWLAEGVAALSPTDHPPASPMSRRTR